MFKLVCNVVKICLTYGREEHIKAEITDQVITVKAEGMAYFTFANGAVSLCCNGKPIVKVLDCGLF